VYYAILKILAPNVEGTPTRLPSAGLSAALTFQVVMFVCGAVPAPQTLATVFYARFTSHYGPD
jgi:hypothetical protein